MFCFLKSALYYSFFATIILIILYFIIRAFLRSQLLSLRKKCENKGKILAFFHPYCHAGGGGEKVLFTMIYGLLSSPKSENPIEIVIYTGDVEQEAEILKKVSRNFGIDLDLGSIKFIRITKRAELLDPKPFFTMIRQIIGSMIFTYKALKSYPPHLFFDTTGFAFSHWVVKTLIPDCKVLTYVHYPFISSDMLDCVVKKEKKFNNNERIADNAWLSRGKIMYYRALIFLYRKMGDYADLVFTNSSWTDSHIRNLWGKWAKKSIRLYPPCNMKQFLDLPAKNRENLIVSFAQFRPEKDHILQLEVFKLLQNRLSLPDLRFYLVGSCRDARDEAFLHDLQKKSIEMGISDSVSFKKNLPFSEILSIFSKAKAGIHTMKAEHFGIAVVELISAGLLVCAHNSAGPKYDIIGEEKEKVIGFLCNEKEDYVNSLAYIFERKEETRLEMVENARKNMQRFDTKYFLQQFLNGFYGARDIWK